MNLIMRQIFRSSWRKAQTHILWMGIAGVVLLAERFSYYQAAKLVKSGVKLYLASSHLKKI